MGPQLGFNFYPQAQALRTFIGRKENEIKPAICYVDAKGERQFRVTEKSVHVDRRATRLGTQTPHAGQIRAVLRDLGQVIEHLCSWVSTSADRNTDNPSLPGLIVA